MSNYLNLCNGQTDTDKHIFELLTFLCTFFRVTNFSKNCYICINGEKTKVTYRKSSRQRRNYHLYSGPLSLITHTGFCNIDSLNMELLPTS